MTGLPDAAEHDLRSIRCGLGGRCGFPHAVGLFLADQRDRQRTPGHNNAQRLFGIAQASSEPHIRILLAPIAPEHLAGAFWRVFEHLRAGAYLPAYQGHGGQWLLTLAGTEDFSSQKIHCPQCTVRVIHGRSSYSHWPALIAQRRTKRR